MLLYSNMHQRLPQKSNRKAPILLSRKYSVFSCGILLAEYQIQVTLYAKIIASIKLHCQSDVTAKNTFLPLIICLIYAWVCYAGKMQLLIFKSGKSKSPAILQKNQSKIGLFLLVIKWYSELWCSSDPGAVERQKSENSLDVTRLNLTDKIFHVARQQTCANELPARC